MERVRKGVMKEEHWIKDRDERRHKVKEKRERGRVGVSRKRWKEGNRQGEREEAKGG